MTYPFRIIATALALAIAGISAIAEETAGTVKTSRGEATIERAGESLAASVGTALHVSDRVVTGAGGIVGITLRDNTRLTVGPDSTLELAQYEFDSTTHRGAMDATVGRGSLAVISGDIAKSNAEAVVFRTPTVTLGVRGTEFIIETGK